MTCSTCIRSRRAGLSKNVMLSSGFAYSDLDNTFSGSRIYGTDFNVGYVPNPLADFGYTNYPKTPKPQDDQYLI